VTKSAVNPTANSAAVNSMDGTWHSVARRSELEEEYPLRVKLGARELAISLVEGQVFATDNICTHAFARLSDGHLEGFEIRCPLHGGGFDVRTGEATAAPCFTQIAVYECRVEGDEVMVKIDERAAPTSVDASSTACRKD
jgi:nitrite reductase/ring-hydroxylating ferredoxin subunit